MFGRSRVPRGERRLELREEDAIQLGYVRDLDALLRAVEEAMPHDATLYIEGRPIAAEIEALLETRHADAHEEVARHTLWPRPKTFHVPLAGTTVSELRALASNHADPEVCDHVVVYRDGAVLLSAHDAGFGYVYVNRELPTEVIDRLRLILAPTKRTA